MSLTREQWQTMYETIKQIERDADYLYFNRRNICQRIKDNCALIKTQIESVIGQQE